MSTAGSTDPTADLQRYLRDAREILLWKLDGLSEYDVRRPLTPTGTNLLGLVKHLSTVELLYLGLAFGRFMDEPVPWLREDAAPNEDMWATAEESRDYLVGLYRRVAHHTDGIVEELGPEAVGQVPWWPEGPVTIQRLLLHVVAETHRHVGQADIVREQIDGRVGVRDFHDDPEAAATNNDVSTVAPDDPDWWRAHRDRLEQIARQVTRP